jgi:hypothetical protein
VLLQNCAYRTAILPDDRVVARKPRRRLAHHAKAGHVMVAPGDQRRAGRRTQRSGMELRVPQSRLCDPIECGRRNDATERARRAEADVVGHDQQHVWRALWRHDARRPPRRGVLGFFLDHAAEFRGRWRELFPVDDNGASGACRVAMDHTLRSGGRGGIARLRLRLRLARQPRSAERGGERRLRCR